MGRLGDHAIICEIEGLGRLQNTLVPDLQEILLRSDRGLLLAQAAGAEDTAERLFRQSANGRSEEIAFPATLRNRLAICWSGEAQVGQPPTRALLGDRGHSLTQIHNPTEERREILLEKERDAASSTWARRTDL